MKKAEAIFIFLLTIAISAVMSELFFSFFIDVYLVPLIGFRPVLAATSMALFITVAYTFVDSKYHFEQKGGSLFKNYKLKKDK